VAPSDGDDMMDEPVLGRLLPYKFTPKPREHMLVTFIGWTLCAIFNGIYAGTIVGIVALIVKAV